MDNTSARLFGGTITLAFIHAFTSSDLLIWVTIMAGITTVAYNLVKIRKELKK